MYASKEVQWPKNGTEHRIHFDQSKKKKMLHKIIAAMKDEGKDAKLYAWWESLRGSGGIPTGTA